MEFKKGDVVFLNKRGLIGDEKIDNTVYLSRNRPYVIWCVKNHNVAINRNGSISPWIHNNHFKLHQLTGDTLQGNKIFKVGDKVKLECRGIIGWERNDYTIFDGLLEDEIYEINYYDVSSVVLINGKSGIHPNHFKKVENGI